MRSYLKRNIIHENVSLSFEQKFIQKYNHLAYLRLILALNNGKNIQLIMINRYSRKKKG